jgi:hypothetical protein
VVVSVVCHGRAIPLLWQALEHPSASVSASVSIALLEKADRLLAQGPLEVCPGSPGGPSGTAVCWSGLAFHRWLPSSRTQLLQLI